MAYVTADRRDRKVTNVFDSAIVHTAKIKLIIDSDVWGTEIDILI